MTGEKDIVAGALYIALGLDVEGLRADVGESTKIIKNFGAELASEASRMGGILDKMLFAETIQLDAGARDVEEQVGEEIEKKLSALERFEKDLLERIESSTDKNLKSRLEKIQRKIDLAKMSDNFSESKTLKKSEFALADVLSNYEKQQADKIAKIQEDAARRTQDLLQSAADIEYGLTHSAFEKQLYDIEQWEKKSLESIEKYKNALEDKGRYEEEAAAIAVAARAKEEEAFKREMDRIQGRIESAQDRLMRLTSSQKDYDLYKAQKQYQQDLKDGVPQGLAKAVYDATIADIGRRAKEDKGGSYTKSKSGSSGGPLFIDFTEPQQKDWADLNSHDLAYDVLAQKKKNRE